MQKATWWYQGLLTGLDDGDQLGWARQENVQIPLRPALPRQFQVPGGRRICTRHILPERCHSPLPRAGSAQPGIPGAPPPHVASSPETPPRPCLAQSIFTAHPPGGAQAASVPNPGQHYSGRRAPSFHLPWIQALKNYVSDVSLKLRVHVCVLCHLSFSEGRTVIPRSPRNASVPRLYGPPG